MERFSFLNAAHTAYLAELYDQYLQHPDSVEPSWRAFFQGFDFGKESSNGISEEVLEEAQMDFAEGEVPEQVVKEFQVIRLIDGYRTRGHLFTKTNPVRERRKYSPTLDIENFGLEQKDLDTVFNAGEILGIGPKPLKDIITHLQKVYCQSIGIEYMYIRKPEEIEWIQDKLNINENQPKFDADRKKQILKKLNEAVSFESFLHTKYVGQKRFSLEGGESLIPALDALIEKAAEFGVKDFVMGIIEENYAENIFDSWMGKIPGRLTAEHVAKILGFGVHDIPVLVKHRLLTPLGQPSEKSTKYFAAVEVFQCAADTKWLGKATKIVSENWKR